jgi:ABC-type transport system substrate-binding protein
LRNVRASAIIFIILIIVSSVEAMQVRGVAVSEESLQTGPYIDKIIYKVISDQDQRILALQTGDIELDTNFFDPSIHLLTLQADPNISIANTLRNGYWHMTINCAKYPLNISGFRRAFAFAFNKTRAADEIADGFAQIQDSIVPYQNPWCIEEKLAPHYYNPQPNIGNQILDDLGFQINFTTGYRETPEGIPFHIRVGYGCSSLYQTCAQIGVDALESLHIDAVTVSRCVNDEQTTWQACDMIPFAVNFYDSNLDWLGDEYWSVNADEDMEKNACNFQNDTFDYWREILLNSSSEEEVYEAVTQMQEILHYEVPRLVLFQNIYMMAYRNDKFTGHVEDLIKSITNPWTMRKIHKLDGTSGGEVSIAINDGPNSFNIYVTNSANSAAILENLWPSLYSFGPNLNPYPDLAESMLTETHADNPSVPAGHTRFTVDIIQNATWNDGEPLTAEDVAFTFIYILGSGVYGNPAINELESLVAAYAPSTYRAVLEFSTESYWQFSHFAYTPIIPKHIFNGEEGIGYEGWDSWNPIFNPSEPNVNCGPFTFSTYEAGEFYEIVKNPLFHYRIEETSTTTTTEIIDNSVPIIIAVISSTSTAIILISASLIYLEKQKDRIGRVDIP